VNWGSKVAIVVECDEVNAWMLRGDVMFIISIETVNDRLAVQLPAEHTDLGLMTQPGRCVSIRTNPRAEARSVVGGTAG
jgi:hypothetical protein